MVIFFVYPSAITFALQHGSFVPREWLAAKGLLLPTKCHQGSCTNSATGVWKGRKPESGIGSGMLRGIETGTGSGTGIGTGMGRETYIKAGTIFTLI